MDIVSAGAVAGTAMAWYAIFNGLAGIAGPMFGGFVRDTTGSFLMAFIPAGIVCLIENILGIAVKLKNS